MLNNLKFFNPTLKQSFVIVFVFFILLGQLLSSGVMLIFKGIDIEQGAALTQFIGYILAFVPSLLYANAKGKTNRLNLEAGLASQAHAKVPITNDNFGTLNPILFFILLFIAALSFMIVIDAIGIIMPIPDWFSKIIEDLITDNGVVWGLINVAVLAALFEEILLRGIILKGLLQRISPMKAIIWSAALFGILHLNPWQAVWAFILGVFFGWIYYRTRSLWAVIFLHFVNNGISTVLPYIFPKMKEVDSFFELFPSSGPYILLLCTCIAIITLISVIIYKNTTPKVYLPISTNES